jgi:hypothetical protein
MVQRRATVPKVGYRRHQAEAMAAGPPPRFVNQTNGLSESGPAAPGLHSWVGADSRPLANSHQLEARMSTQDKRDNLKDLPTKKVDADSASQPKGGTDSESANVKGGLAKKAAGWK